MVRQAVQQEWLSVPEAARIVGVHPATMWRWINEGYVLAHQVGPKRRIRKSDLEDAAKVAPRGKVWS